MRVGVPTSSLRNWLRGDEIIATDEGSAVALAVGYYLATGKTGIVFMGADGFCNALNILTSLVIPYEIPINWVISAGRQEEWHIKASRFVQNYAKGKSNITIIR